MRVIRGATRVAQDTAAQIVERTSELLVAIMDRHGLATDDVAFILFTATQDLTSEFPAAAAPAAGLGAVPRMCAAEMAVAGALTQVVRVAVFASPAGGDAAGPVYLHGTEALLNPRGE